MLLNVADMNGPVNDRYKYLSPINKCFNKNFLKLDDYKACEELESILQEFVTLDSTRKAIRRAENLKKLLFVTLLASN